MDASRRVQAPGGGRRRRRLSARPPLPRPPPRRATTRFASSGVRAQRRLRVFEPNSRAARDALGNPDGTPASPSPVLGPAAVAVANASRRAAGLIPRRRPACSPHARRTSAESARTNFSRPWRTLAAPVPRRGAGGDRAPGGGAPPRARAATRKLGGDGAAEASTSASLASLSLLATHGGAADLYRDADLVLRDSVGGFRVSRALQACVLLGQSLTARARTGVADAAFVEARVGEAWRCATGGWRAAAGRGRRRGDGAWRDAWEEETFAMSERGGSTRGKTRSSSSRRCRIGPRRRSRPGRSSSKTEPGGGEGETTASLWSDGGEEPSARVEIARDSVMVMRVASPIFLCTNCPRVPSRALARAPRVASSAPPPSRVPPARSAPTDTKSLGTGPNTSPRARWTRRSSSSHRTRTRGRVYTRCRTSRTSYPARASVSKQCSSSRVAGNRTA